MNIQRQLNMSNHILVHMVYDPITWFAHICTHHKLGCLNLNSLNDELGMINLFQTQCMQLIYKIEQM